MNPPTPDQTTITRAIHNFWKYTSQKLADIDFDKLHQTELPLINELDKTHDDWRDYSMKLSATGVIYMAISELFKKILEEAGLPGNALTFLLRPDQFELKDYFPELKQEIRKNIPMPLREEDIAGYKLMFGRYLFIITAVGNKQHFSLVEEIYAVSREYSLGDNWQVVKYLPPITRPDTDQIQHPEGDITYVYHGKKLSISSAAFANEHCRRSAQLMITAWLSNIFGEYSTAMGIEIINFCVSAEGLNFSPISELYKQEHPLVFGEHKLCRFCNLRDYNTEFKVIDHSKFNEGNEDTLPEGAYCTYCIKIINNLFQ